MVTANAHPNLPRLKWDVEIGAISLSGSSFMEKFPEGHDAHPGPHPAKKDGGSGCQHGESERDNRPANRQNTNRSVH